MKLWVDDIRFPPTGYTWCKSVNDAKFCIKESFKYNRNYFRFSDIEVIDIDHDAGDYAKDGGDYIKLLDWLEENNYSIPIHIHSMNPVGVQNMRAIIQRNGWKEI